MEFCIFKSNLKESNDSVLNHLGKMFKLKCNKIRKYKNCMLLEDFKL